MPETLPYVLATGTLEKVLEKIRAAATPDRFTQDFLASTLGMKGGTPRPVIPFLKKIGFLATDGSPTELYKRFRNPSEAGSAVADAIRFGYRPLFEMNENVATLSDSDLKGLIVQATGLEKGSRPVQAMFGSFKVLSKLASFAAGPKKAPPTPPDASLALPPTPAGSGQEQPLGLNLAYTINLNLPATSDIAVFNAIFKALRDNLLKP
jgi:hypothetical protein